MTLSQTASATFNIASARFLTSKIATDLRTMHRFYGLPPMADIDDYADEATQLLNKGYLKKVEYGLRRLRTDGEYEWVLKLSYVVNSTGTLVDQNPGGVPTTAPKSGAAFYSYLTKSDAFRDLSTAEQAVVEAALPVMRVGRAETALAAGSYGTPRSYERDGTGFSRTTFVAS